MDVAAIRQGGMVTFSIVARCSHTGQLGVGALTAMIGVGKLVTHARVPVSAPLPHRRP